MDEDQSSWTSLPIPKQVPGYTGSLSAPSCELWRRLAKFGELWRTHNAIFMRTSLTFTRVPAKVPHLHQSSGEGAFSKRVAFRMCPKFVTISVRIVFSFRMVQLGGYAQLSQELVWDFAARHPDVRFVCLTCLPKPEIPNYAIVNILLEQALCLAQFRSLRRFPMEPLFE